MLKFGTSGINHSLIWTNLVGRQSQILSAITDSYYEQLQHESCGYLRKTRGE